MRVIDRMIQECPESTHIRDRIGCDCNNCKQFWLEYYNEVPRPEEEG